MKNFFFLGFLSFFIWNTSAQTYTIPWAQQQPEWVFPIWFENGDGQRDTIYYAIDSLSGDPWDAQFDTIFGDVVQVLDTSKFQGFLGCYIDSSFLISKSNTFSLLSLQSNQTNAIEICFWKPQLPIILRWDRSLFYSDSLPFPDLDPAPRAQGEMYYDVPFHTDNCEPSFPILMTDTVSVLYFQCYKSDSIEFTGNGVSYLDFSVHPWIGYIAGINAPESNETTELFPNPASEFISVFKNQDVVRSQWQITDLTGRIFSTGQLSAKITIIEVSHFASGCYLFNEETKQTTRTIIFIKQ